MARFTAQFSATLLVAFTLTAQAETFIVATDSWEGYTNKDGTGYYLDLLNKIYKPLGYTLELKFVPYSRSLRMVENGEADLTPSVYQGDLPPEFISTAFILEQDAADVAIMAEKFPDWQGISSLDGKQVVARIDYGFDRLLGPKVIYSEKPNLSGMLQMLMAGRVDAVADYEADIHSAEEKSHLQPKYVIKKGLLKNPIYMAFSATAKGKKLRSEYESTMATLIKSGELKALYLMTHDGLENFPYP